MNYKLITRSNAFNIALIFHTAVLFVLCVSMIMVQPKPVVTPEPQVIKIGEQVTVPPELSMSGMPIEATESLPPAGEIEPEPDINPVDDIPEQMLKDPDEPMPKDLSKNPEAGLPGEPTPMATPSDGAFGPINEGKPGLDSDGGPELFGEKIEGRTLYILDVSGSMEYSTNSNTRRIDILKAELINCIGLMTETDEFDIVVYSGNYRSWLGYSESLWNALTFATEANKAIAIEWVKNIVTGGSTPTYEALKWACFKYDKDLKNMILITDGVPDDSTGKLIIEEAPDWLKEFTECKLICISIGTDGLQFIKELANAVGGVYNAVDQ